MASNVNFSNDYYQVPAKPSFVSKREVIIQNEIGRVIFHRQIPVKFLGIPAGGIYPAVRNNW